MSIRKVGLVGCGAMGSRMAANLLKAGFDLTAFDLDREAVMPLVNQGAKAAGSPAGAAADADAVILMLHNPVVETVMNGDNGVMSGIKPGAILIDSGNSDPRLAFGRFEQCKNKGVHFLDVGVSGGPAGAQDATLAVLVGGEQEAFEQARPVFAAIGSNIFYMGGPGAGHLSKLISIIIGQGTLALIGEALSLAEKKGLEMPTLVKALATTNARSAFLDNAVKVYHEEFPADWKPKMRKIYQARAGSEFEPWALAIADEIGQPLPMVGLANELSKLYRTDSDHPIAEMIDKIFYRVVAMP